MLDRRLLFVTGKGGVGKSSVAASLALLAARTGRKTLLCEIDDKGDLADFLEVGPLRFSAVEVQPNLSVMAMDTEASLREYLRIYLRLPVVTRLGPMAKAFDFVATAAPGVREILTVGKLTYEVREKHYDLVVVDAPATGHIVGQLAAPHAINDLVRVGLIAGQTHWMVDILDDPDRTGVVVVSSPEEMPVVETIELIDRVRHDTGVDVAAVVANRVLPELFGRGEEEVFELLDAVSGRASLAELLDSDPAPLLDGARLAVGRRRAGTQHLARLRDGIGSLPLLYVPELFLRRHGIRATTRMADHLAEELS